MSNILIFYILTCTALYGDNIDSVRLPFVFLVIVGLPMVRWTFIRTSFGAVGLFQKTIVSSKWRLPRNLSNFSYHVTENGEHIFLFISPSIFIYLSNIVLFLQSIPLIYFDVDNNLFQYVWILDRFQGLWLRHTLRICPRVTAQDHQCRLMRA